DGRRLCYTANRRHRAYFDVWVRDLATSEDRCVMAQDATLTALAWSPDGFSLLVSRENTNLDNDLFLLPLDGLNGGEPRLLTPHTAEAAYTHPCFAPDGRTLYLLTNRDRELLAPSALDLTAPSLEGEHTPLRILAEGLWEAEDLALSQDGRLLAWA